MRLCRSGEFKVAAVSLSVVAAMLVLGGTASAQTELFAWNNGNELWRTETAPPPRSAIVGSTNVGATIAEIEAGGGVIYGTDTGDNTNLHSIDPFTGEIFDTLTLTFPPEGNVLTSLEFVYGTLYAGLTTEGGGAGETYLSTVNLSTGAVTVIGATGAGTPLGGLAWEVTTGTMFAISAGGSVATLFTIDINTGAGTSLGAVSLDGGNFGATALEFGGDGLLYALPNAFVDPRVGQLLVIDPVSVTATDVGTTGISAPVALTWAPPPPDTTLLAWNNAQDDLWSIETSPPPVSTGFGGVNPDVIISEVEAGGGVIYGTDTDDNTNLHLIDPATGVIFDTLTLTFPAQGNVLTALEFVGGTLYAGLTTEGGGPGYLSTVDLTSGVVSVLGPQSPLLGGLAYDISSSTMFAITAGGSSAELLTFDLSTGSWLSNGVVTLDGGIFNATALEFGGDGVLYSLPARRDALAGQLLMIDPVSAIATDLGPTNIPEPVALTFAPPPPDEILDVWDPSTRDLWRVTTAPPPTGTLIGGNNPVSPIPDIEAGLGVIYGSNTDGPLRLIDPTTGVVFDSLSLTFPPEGNALTALEFVHGTLYAGLTSAGGGSAYLATVDLTSGVVSVIGATGVASPLGGLAYNQSRNTMFAISAGGSSAELFTINLFTGAAASVGQVTVDGQAFDATALEFGSDGVLYSLATRFDPLAGQLLMIDPVGALAVDLGATGVPEPNSLTLNTVLFADGFESGDTSAW